MFRKNHSVLHFNLHYEAYKPKNPKQIFLDSDHIAPFPWVGDVIYGRLLRPSKTKNPIRWYTIIHPKSSYSEIKEDCKPYNGHYLELNFESENALLEQKLKSILEFYDIPNNDPRNVWFGLFNKVYNSRRQTTNDWTWNYSR